MAQIILDSNNNLIQGDFDNATLNNRTKLQTTTTNATTNVYVVPNGSSTSAGVSVANNSSLTNASKIVMATNGSTDTQIISGINGSGTYLPLSFYTNNAQSMIIDTANNVGIGTSSPARKLDVAATTGANIFGFTATTGTNECYGKISNSGGDFWIGLDNSTGSTFGPGGYSANFYYAGAYPMKFWTNNAERMRIDSSGVLRVGSSSSSATTPNNATGSGYVCANLGASGILIDAAVSGTTVALFNRAQNDGTIVSLRQDANEEGTISVSGTTVSYNGGHLSRWSQWQNEIGKPSVYRGSVLESVDAMCEWEKDGEPLPNEQATKTIVSTTVASKAVAGVFDMYDTDDENNPYDFYVAQSGDFVIRIAQGVTVQNGDLLESAGDGTAKPQTDDICRSSTIAKVTSNYVSATYEDGSYCVPCILMIG